MATLKEALFSATFVGIDTDGDDDIFARVNYVDESTMVEGSTESCLFVTTEDEGEDFTFTWDEVVEMHNANNFTVFALTPVVID